MRSHLMKLIRQRQKRGNALIEFALGVPFLVFVTVGAFAVGINLDRYLKMRQLSRSGSHMYSRGLDFTKPEVRELLFKVAAGLEMTATEGQGVIYLSTVVKASSGSNEGRPVVFHQIRLGNGSLAASKIATPTTISSTGHVYDYENDGNAVAALPGILTMNGLDRVYVAEVFHDASSLAFPGLFSVGQLMYSRTFF